MSEDPVPDEVKQTVATLAEALGENTKQAQWQLKRVVRHIGPEAALAFLARTQEIEAQGGLLVKDQSRRRTPGGVFLYLVRESLPREEQRKVFPWNSNGSGGTTQGQATEQAATPTGPSPAEAWAGRAEALAKLMESREIGRATTMKVTLIGRPGKVSVQGPFVMTTMRGPEKTPDLPKGLPPMPSASKLLYVVYIAEKQWKKVKEAIQNPDDVLIVEGHLTYEEALKKMSVFTSSITTKGLEQAKRAAQKPRAEAASS